MTNTKELRDFDINHALVLLLVPSHQWETRRGLSHENSLDIKLPKSQ